MESNWRQNVSTQGQGLSDWLLSARYLPAPDFYVTMITLDGTKYVGFTHQPDPDQPYVFADPPVEVTPPNRFPFEQDVQPDDPT